MRRREEAVFAGAERALEDAVVIEQGRLPVEDDELRARGQKPQNEQHGDDDRGEGDRVDFGHYIIVRGHGVMMTVRASVLKLASRNLCDSLRLIVIRRL